MQSLVIILLKINLVLLLFAAAYYFILRRLTFYSLNRGFLIFGILFSSIYPFIDLTELFYQQKKIPIAVTEWIPVINQQVTEGIHWKWIIGAFCLGVLIMAVRLVRQFISLYLLHKRSEKGSINNTPVRIIDEQLSPFSFWKHIYINPALHKTDELEHIIAHENIHVGQLHTADIILAELTVVFYWFNPGVWLMKKAIKENLEFITDEKVLRAGTDRKSYQYSLLDVGQLKSATTIANSFNLSDLKKRIRMMNARRSSKLTLGRYIFVLPVLIFVSLAFTIARKEIIKDVPIADKATAFHNPSDIERLPENKEPVTATIPSAQPRVRTGTTQKETARSVNKPQERTPFRAVSADSLNQTVTTVTGIRRVQGIQIPDTATGLKQTPPAAAATSEVITVIGHPKNRNNTGPQQDSPAKDSSAERQLTPERVVTGYRTPERKN